MNTDQFLIIGTAGHIDHGKTALIKRLTGIDTDRLIEEKERGITIDIGFAYLKLENAGTIGIVDVPGHEKFIRNMMAGASGIDILMMVIAADEGIMPQTVEHLNICQLLGIKEGLIVLTKTDLVDEEWLYLVTDDIKNYVKNSFLADAKIFPVSSVTGQGIIQLKNYLNDRLPDIKGKSHNSPFRMFIDRSFTMKGFGTVVTGTVLTGKVKTAESLQILPDDFLVKIRNIQVHNQYVDEAKAGQRTAINLQNIEKISMKRGQALCAVNNFTSTMMLDASISLLKTSAIPLKKRTRIRFHLGTAEIMARIIPLSKEELQPGDKGLVQIRLEASLQATIGDKFVIRSYSPINTIGGGSIIDVAPHKKNYASEAYINMMQHYIETPIHDKIIMLIEQSALTGLSITNLVQEFGFFKKSIQEIVDKEIASGNLYSLQKDYQYIISKSNFKLLIDKIEQKVKQFHEKKRLKKGISRDELKVKFPFLNQSAFNNLFNYLKNDYRFQIIDDIISLKEYSIQRKPQEEKIYRDILEQFFTSDLKVKSLNEIYSNINAPKKKIQNIIDMMITTEELFYIKPNLLFTSEFIDEIKKKIVEFLHKNSKLNVSDMKSMFNFSRKYAIPILEFLDKQKITERRENYRILKKDLH